MPGKKNYELEIRIEGQTDRSLQTSINQARAELDRLERSAGLTSRAVSDSFGGMSIGGIEGLAAMSDKYFSAIANAAKIASIGVGTVAGASIGVGANFESQMSTVQSISNASESDMVRLNNLAKEMGRTTKFSATEAGQGLEYMAMAGWKTNDMMNGLPGIMNLAAASGEDLGMVSDIVTDAMTAFGMQANESTKFADVLAQASSNSNTNVAMMGETFKYVAPVAGALEYNIKDVAIATGIMANSGIKASEAGTALRSIFTNLAKPTEQMRGYMESIGVSLTDDTGKMKTFRQVMDDLREGFSDLKGKDKRAEYAAGIAGKYGMSGLLAIVNATQEDYDRLKESIDNSTGAAERMAKIRMDNLAGDFKLLISAAEGAGIGIYEGLSGPLRGVTQMATGWLYDFAEGLEEGLPTTIRKIKQFGKSAAEGLEPIINAGKWFVDHPQVIEGSLIGISTAFATFKAVKVVKDVSTTLAGLSGVISAWPVAIAGITVGSILGIGAAINEMEQSAINQNLADHFGDITLSMRELDEAAKFIVGNQFLDNISALGEASEQTDMFYESLQRQIKQLNKQRWMLSVGINLDEDESQSYVDSVNQYVDNVQAYITSSGQEVELSMSLIMDGMSGKEAMIQNSNDYYVQLNNELQPLKEQLQQALKDVMEDGLILPDEDAYVQSILAQIDNITQKVADAQSKTEMQMLTAKYGGASLTSDSFQNLQQDINEYIQKGNEGLDNALRTSLNQLNMQGASQDEIDQAMQGYYINKAEKYQNAMEFMKNTIVNTYGNEIGPAMDQLNQEIENGITELLNNESYHTAEDWANAINNLEETALQNAGKNLSTEQQGALKNLVEGMLPNAEAIQQIMDQYASIGGNMESPLIKGLEKSLGDTRNYEALSGDADAMWSYVGEHVADSPELAAAIELARQNGSTIPEAVIAEINSKGDETRTAINQYRSLIKSQFGETLDVDMPINIAMIAKATGNTIPEIIGPYKNASNFGGGMGKTLSSIGKGYKIESHAIGGLIERPTLSFFAENCPEMAIPLDGSSRAIALWQETGQLLGAYENNTYSSMYNSIVSGETKEERIANNTSAAPTLQLVQNFYGNIEKEDIDAANTDGYETFCEYLDRYYSERRRASF